MKKFVFTVFILVSFSAFSQKSFEFEGKYIDPGSKERFNIQVPYENDQTTSIPVTVIHQFVKLLISENINMIYKKR